VAVAAVAVVAARLQLPRAKSSTRVSWGDDDMADRTVAVHGHRETGRACRAPPGQGQTGSGRFVGGRRRRPESGHSTRWRTTECVPPRATWCRHSRAAREQYDGRTTGEALLFVQRGQRGDMRRQEPRARLEPAPVPCLTRPPCASSSARPSSTTIYTVASIPAP